MANPLIQLLEFKDHVPPSDFDSSLFRGNEFEAKVLKDYLRDKGKSVTGIFAELKRDYADTGKFQYKVTRGMVSNPLSLHCFEIGSNIAIDIRNDTPLCRGCFTDCVWFQMAFLYRTTIASELPREISSRPSCWYGINCSTMRHNPTHAKKLNHICEQTKF